MPMFSLPRLTDQEATLIPMTKDIEQPRTLNEALNGLEVEKLRRCARC
jgi:hypothetical protein